MVNVPFILRAVPNYLVKYAGLILMIRNLSSIVSNNLMSVTSVLGCT
jgi:hypothetical protein